MPSHDETALADGVLVDPGWLEAHLHDPSVRIDGLYDDRGAFLPAAGLRELFSAIGPGGDLITYCTIGGRASTAWFVLTYLLGREHVRVYDGSWADWGRMADTPVEQPGSEVQPQPAGEE